MGKLAYTDKGFVNSFSELPIIGNALGDFYLVKDEGIQYYWPIIFTDGNVETWLPVNVLVPDIVIEPITSWVRHFLTMGG